MGAAVRLRAGVCHLAGSAAFLRRSKVARHRHAHLLSRRAGQPEGPTDMNIRIGQSLRTETDEVFCSLHRLQDGVRMIASDGEYPSGAESSRFNQEEI